MRKSKITNVYVDTTVVLFDTNMQKIVSKHLLHLFLLLLEVYNEGSGFVEFAYFLIMAVQLPKRDNHSFYDV